MWPNAQDPEDLVTFTKEILNGKLHFLCSQNYKVHKDYGDTHDPNHNQ